MIVDVGEEESGEDCVYANVCVLASFLKKYHLMYRL